MGQEIHQTEFSDAERERFAARLDDNLSALRQLLDRPGFGAGQAALGAELELYIVDDQGRPLAVNQQLLEAADDSRLTLELNRYNLEANLTPTAIDSAPFSALEREMESVLAMLNTTARSMGGRVLPIGILPTLTPDDFTADMMTPEDRYRALMLEIRRRRKDPISIALEGIDSLHIETDLVTCEGANTSLQIHYRSAPERFTNLFNAIQLTTPLIVGIGANSPLFLGRRLWHETRVPLFRQAVDARDEQRRELHMPKRVHFGHGWVRKGAYELFAEAVCLFSTVLPLVGDEEPLAVLARGDTPSLHELAMHMGTIWPWNRPVFDHHDGGHVRVELRAISAGPTCIDMVANAAFAVGLAEGLADVMDEIIPSMPYQALQQNLDYAARSSLQATLLWPSLKRKALEKHSLVAVVEALLPVAAEGLSRIGIADAESSRYLDCIAQRVQREQNGASWQLDQLAALELTMPREQALHHMLERYITHVNSAQPVASWPVDPG